jgi:hypothetical protein
VGHPYDGLDRKLNAFIFLMHFCWNVSSPTERISSTSNRLGFQTDGKGGIQARHASRKNNFFVSRRVFDRIGGFDERLEPGASVYPKTWNFAHRLPRCGIGIGYACKAVVCHCVDLCRLTDEYFKQSEFRQGRSQLPIRNRSAAEIFFNLVRALAQYAYYPVVRKERNCYRSKGRVDYLGMIDAKQTNADHLEER